MDLTIHSYQRNKEFYTIRQRYSLNNRHELYRRTSIIYGMFVDSKYFKYNVVHNGQIQDDGFKRYCSVDDLVKHDNDRIYIFDTYDDAKKVNDILKKENLLVPMKYKEDYDEIAKIIKDRTIGHRTGNKNF